MSRMTRIVVPGLPHHVTQRGVGAAAIFDDDADRELYLSLLREQAERVGLGFEAWCLLADGVHLIAVPDQARSLGIGIGEAHRLYTRARNRNEGMQGSLFGARFASCVLDKAYLARAVRRVEMAPVRAGLADRPSDYRWSSARLHLGMRKTDPLSTGDQAPEMAGDWSEFMRERADDDEEALALHVSTGRPWGSARFVARLERKLGRPLTAGKPGWPKGVPRKKRKKGK